MTIMSYNKLLNTPSSCYELKIIRRYVIIIKIKAILLNTMMPAAQGSTSATRKFTIFLNS
jgi:hypothetical protein